VRLDVVIVIPAWNEEKTIEKVINGVKSKAKIIVVNDCSSDQTSELAERAGAIVVNHSENKGYDAALSSGFDKAAEHGFNYIITFDADGQHISESIDKMITKLEEGFHLVLGVRPKKARLTEEIMGWYFKARFGVEDILCGVKAYHIDLYNGNKGFDHINSIGSELSLYALKKNIAFEQIPLTVLDREDASRFGNALKGNLRIAKAFTRILKKDLLS
jgi:glycosyltransferase involved in cell wall biosynthesis